jgi:hypothetical protein
MMKLIMTWDFRPGRETAYFDWAMKTFVPSLMELGLQPVDAWYTVHGDAPQMLAGILAEDRETLRQALSSSTWRELHDQLMTYVTNYSQKVVKATNSFQF